MVVCRSNPESDSYQEASTLIVEVLSRSTRRTDEAEKRDAYQTIPSLVHYWMVEQEEAIVVAYRRSDHGFVREVIRDWRRSYPSATCISKFPWPRSTSASNLVPRPKLTRTDQVGSQAATPTAAFKSAGRSDCESGSSRAGWPGSD